MQTPQYVGTTVLMLAGLGAGWLSSAAARPQPQSSMSRPRVQPPDTTAPTHHAPAAMLGAWPGPVRSLRDFLQSPITMVAGKGSQIHWSMHVFGVALPRPALPTVRRRCKLYIGGNLRPIPVTCPSTDL